MVYDIKTVHNNIRKVRLYRNYKQGYLAVKLNISQNAYSKIETGETKVTVARLIQIAAVFEINVKELIDMSEGLNEVISFKRTTTRTI